MAISRTTSSRSLTCVCDLVVVVPGGVAWGGVVSQRRVASDCRRAEGVSSEEKEEIAVLPLLRGGEGGERLVGGVGGINSVTCSVRRAAYFGTPFSCRSDQACFGGRGEFNVNRLRFG